MLPEPKLPRPPLKPYGTSLLFIMGYPKRSCQIKVKNLKVSLWLIDLCTLMGTQKIQTSPYHPQTNSQCQRFNSTLIGMLGMLPPEKKSEWKNHIGMLVHTYNCTQNSATGFGPYYLMYGRQPQLPVDVTLGLAPHSIMMPTHQNLCRRCGNTGNGLIKRQKHSKPRKHNARIMIQEARQQPWRLGTWSLVCVTAFKGHHKIHDQWKNREYVVERWPFPNVPVYVACPRDGEGCSWTLHRNYLLPISSNIDQDEKDAPVAEVENTNTSTPVPSLDSEPADAGPSGTVMSSTAGNTPLGSLDQPALLRHGTQTT